MLEQSLINPNFLGRDGFRWFVGQVVAYQKSDVNENPDAKGGYRCKVRILGHHPSNNTIRDENLPWAHVLVPLNMGSGNANTGVSFNSQGGEIVIGFFLDGDDGQQPIVIGSFFTGSDVLPTKTWEEVLNKGTSFFQPFSPSKTRISPPSTTPINAATTGGSAASGLPEVKGTVIGKNRGESKTILQEKTKPNQNEVIKGIPKCQSGNGILSGITNLLKEFIRIANTIQNAIGTYIDPVLNAISDIGNEIKKIADAIVDLLVGLLKKVRDVIISKINELLKKFIDGLIPAKLKVLKQAAADKAADSIWCVFERITKKLTKFITDFLTNLIGKIVNIPICAAEQFLGSILGTVINEITSELDEILKEVSSILQGKIGTVLGIVQQVINFSSSAISFLSCEGNECAKQYAYELNKGYIPDSDLNFQNIINYSPSKGASNLSKDVMSNVDSFLQNVGFSSNNIDQPRDNYGCDATTLNCGLPKVSIFGGDGVGAIGESVVSSLGQVIGINILNGGVGYTNSPIISIDDNCNNGGGAQGYAVINNGKVTQVVITETGSGYLGPSNTGIGSTSVGIGTNHYNINPITESGSEVVGTLANIIILDPGFGYTNSDIINDSACPNDLEMKPVVDDAGRILGITINNPGSSIRVFPELQINTDNGQGAILLPVLEFYDPKNVSYVETNSSKIGKIIYCSENHG
jgi:hypothetical protein